MVTTVIVWLAWEIDAVLPSHMEGTMVLHVPTSESLMEEQTKRLVLLQLEDDTEDAPWMVMGSLQFEAAWRFYESLQYFAETRQQPWFVAGMLPILFTVPGEPGKKQLAPDV